MRRSTVRRAPSVDKTQRAAKVVAQREGRRAQNALLQSRESTSEVLAVLVRYESLSDRDLRPLISKVRQSLRQIIVLIADSKQVNKVIGNL